MPNNDFVPQPQKQREHIEFVQCFLVPRIFKKRVWEHIDFVHCSLVPRVSPYRGECGAQHARLHTLLPWGSQTLKQNFQGGCL